MIDDQPGLDPAPRAEATASEHRRAARPEERSERGGERAGTRTAPTTLPDHEILRRGLVTFAELGYDATTVRELAARLEVSHNFINDRYGSKAAFWRAVAEFGMRPIKLQLDAVFDEGGDDAICLRAVVRTFYRVTSHNPQVNSLVADESVRDSERLDYLYENFSGDFIRRLTPVVKRLMDAGRMPRVPMDLLFVATTGPALALTHHQMARRLGRTATSAAAADRMAETLADLVLTGLLPSPPPD